MHNYPINILSVVGTHLSGLGYYNARKLFTFLDMPYMSFKAYKKCENYLGEKGLEVISMQVRKEALKEELSLTSERFTTEKYGEKPALTVSLDMGWQKRRSGRRYDSPSGVLHCLGARTKNHLFICFSK